MSTAGHRHAAAPARILAGNAGGSATGAGMMGAGMSPLPLPAGQAETVGERADSLHGGPPRPRPFAVTGISRTVPDANRSPHTPDLLPVCPLSDPPDPRLVDLLGATTCLREGLLPMNRIGDATRIAATDPAAFARNAALLHERFGRIARAQIRPRDLDDTIRRLCGAPLARRAESSVPAAESCRGYGGPALLPRAALVGVLLILALLIAPGTLLNVIFGWVLFWTLASLGLRIAAALSQRKPQAEPPPLPHVGAPPVVSIIVALYRESSIAPRLVRRLGRLDWPRDRLDVVLAVEADDTATRDALLRAGLPGWMRVVVVPPGQPRTKPRALNYALHHCRGSIVGVYDAEDAPEADQIARIVAAFRARGPRVACLQGMLDYYNPQTNWLSRCFTIEYAVWFRLILPGIARLGLPVPLGGTTLFFRRQALEELGGWDAHNVTEDADLGIRLVRHGWRTELVATVTAEEANCRALPWVKQRSRWIKGYMMTWLTHMRDPLLLWRQLGPRGFAGFQIIFLGSLTQMLFAPLLWSFWLLALGLRHPLADGLPAPFLTVMTAVFLLSEAVTITLGVIALRRTRHRISPLWVPTLHFYYPLGTLAAWKAAWEMLVRPFWWDKTAHGIFDAQVPQAQPAGADGQPPGLPGGSLPKAAAPIPPATRHPVGPFRRPGHPRAAG